MNTKLLWAMLAYAVLDNRIPPLWETRPEDFPLAGEVLLPTEFVARPSCGLVPA